MTTRTRCPGDGAGHTAAAIDQAAPFADALVALAICAPSLLGIFPIHLALAGIGFGPTWWVAVSWQLASMVTWTILSIPLLRAFRRRTDVNIAAGQPALTLGDDGPALASVLLLAIAVHALTLASASDILMLGRGRPQIPGLVIDILLRYAPMNVMTMLGFSAAAIVAAEHRARFAEVTTREGLERQLSDARQEVLAALTDLNGPAARPEPIASDSPIDRIPVTIGNRTLLVGVDDIDWIEASSHYAQLHVGTQRYLVRQSMRSLEQRLDPRRFARIHRSTIVNLDRVAEVRPFDRRSYVVILRDGRRLRMSRRRRRLMDFLAS